MTDVRLFQVHRMPFKILRIAKCLKEDHLVMNRIFFTSFPMQKYSLDRVRSSQENQLRSRHTKQAVEKCDN